MNKKIHFLLLTSLTLLVMLVSALHPMIAHADDSTPSAPATQPPAADTSAPAAVATQPPAVDTSVAPASTSVAPADTSVAPASTSVSSTDESATSAATTVAPTEATVASTDTTAAPTDTTVAPTDTSTLMATVPTGTSVVVVDATGTPVPLATQTAAAIVETGDPIYCDNAATTIAAGATNCTSSYSTLADLVSYLTSNQPTTDGTIWIEQGSDTSSSAISIDGSALTTWAKNKLTLQGGWNKTSTNGAVVTSNPSSFAVPISITNWQNDVTLNDIVISGVTNGAALTVRTTGKINLHHVQANSNSGSTGAILDNTSGPATSSINIDENSTFNENTFGLSANSNGEITLMNVIADDNGITVNPLDENPGDDGAYLSNTGIHYGGTGAVSVTDSDFSGNVGKGLEAYSTTDITLTEVTAEGNGKAGTEDGAFLNNSIPGYMQPSYPIDVEGSTFSNNTDNGLEAHANNDITLTNVTAEDNGTDGAYLDNCLYDGISSCSGSGNIYVDTDSSKNVSGSSYFDTNTANGLEILSTGTLTLYNVTANSNTGEGALLGSSILPIGGSIYVDTDSNVDPGSSYFGTDGSNADYGNGSNGLEAYANGEIDLYNVWADYNGQSKVTGAGAVLNNLGGNSGVYIDTGYYPSNNDFSYNYNDGLDITSKGEIDLYNVVADYNGQSKVTGAGAVLAGGSGEVSFGAGSSPNNDFSYNYDDGLDVTSTGRIDLYDTVADCNGTDNSTDCKNGKFFNPADGAYLDNCLYNGTSCAGSGLIEVGYSTFGELASGDSGLPLGNGGTGLEVHASGVYDEEEWNDWSISLSDVTADYNGLNGAYLDNCISNGTTCAGFGYVRIWPDYESNSSDFSYNGTNGLYVTSNLGVDLENVVADYNGQSHKSGAGAVLNSVGDFGVDIDTYDSPYNEFSYNYNDGLDVTSTGDIDLYDVVANYNGQSGIKGAGAVLNGGDDYGVSIDTDDSPYNEFSYNYNDGLDVTSNSEIDLFDVVADYNGQSGIKGAGAVLNNVASGGDNVDVDIDDSPNDEFSYNYNDGLDVTSAGQIDLYYVKADCNGTDNSTDCEKDDFLNSADGVYLDNTSGDSSISIDYDPSNNPSYIGTSDFSSNSANGLEVYSYGDVSLTNVTADYNNYDGALLGYPSFKRAIGGTVAVTNSDFSNNYGYRYCDEVFSGCTEDPAGLEVHGFGDKNLSDVTADNNAYDGVYLDVFGNVSIDMAGGSSEFNNNGQSGEHGDGLDVDNFFGGDISLDSVTANDNYDDGADLINAGDPPSITVTDSHFNGNGDDGLYLNTNGDATINCGSTANGNSVYDVDGFVGGTFTNGLTLTTNGVSSGMEVDTPCGGGAGNSSGPSVGGGGSLPWNVVTVPDSGSQGTPLSCSQYVGTELVLPNGDHVLLPCPIGSTPGTNGSLHGLSSGNLPGKLDSKFSLASAFDVEVNPALSGGMMTVSFKIPAGKTDANFAILHWDGTKWVNLGGSINPPGYFSVTTSLTGDFVLVTQ